MCIWSIEARLSGGVHVAFDIVRQVLLMGAKSCCDLESRLKAGVVLGKHKATISIGARIVIMVEIAGATATECTTTAAAMR